MIEQINSLRSEIEGQDLSFLAGTQYVYHCHHFNLFHDQTVEDALGETEALALKARVAHEASHQFLQGLVEATGASTPAERLELASQLFRWAGHGRLQVLAGAEGGEARGEFLHYGFTWRDKYGAVANRLHPIDAFAAGYSAAAAEVAHNLPAGSLRAVETDCYALKHPACRFVIDRPTEVREPFAEPVAQATIASHCGATFGGQDEDRISAIAAGLKEFIAGAAGDERGLMNAFGVYVTLHLSGYYNLGAYEAIHRIEKKSPALLPMVEGLFGESGHVCVFYTFGNILLSPEWEGLVGPLSSDPADIVSFCCAIARGLGFGHWAIQELVPGERLVLRAPANYEAPFYRSRYGISDRPRSYVFANAARAFMRLAHDANLGSKPALNNDLYQRLFRQGSKWNVEQTHCTTTGADFCEAVVTRAK